MMINMKFIIPLFFAFITLFTIPSYANQDCSFSSEKYSYSEKLTNECIEQLEKNSLSFAVANADKPVNVFADAKFFSVAWGLLNGDLPEYKEYGNYYFLVMAISMILVMAIAIAFVFISVGIIVGLVKGAVKGDVNFKVLAGSLLIKIPLFFISKKLYLYCMGLSVSLMLAFSYNVVNLKKKMDVNQFNINQLVSVGAERDAQNRVKDILNYSTCVIQHDKQMLFNAHLTNQYKFDDSSKYHSCMMDSAADTVAAVNDVSYNSLYFRKAYNCGSRNIGLEEMSCALSKFGKDDILVKEALEKNEVLITSIADKIIRYGCANIVGVSRDESHAFKQYCYDLNPITRELKYDDKERVQLISTAPSAAEIQKDVNSLVAIIKQANINSASKNIKENFTPSVIQINELSAFLVFLFENDDISLIKMLAKSSYDYDFTKEEVLVFSEDSDNFFTRAIDTFDSILEMFFGDESKLPGIHERIRNEIDYLTADKNAFANQFLFPMIDFLGGDVTQSLGLSGNEGSTLRFNVIGSIFTSAVNTSYTFLIPAMGAKIIHGVSELVTNLRVDSKPSYAATKLQGFSGFMSAQLFLIVWLTLGLAVYILGSNVKMIFEGAMGWFTNVMKLLNTKDAAMLFESRGMSGIGFNEIGQKIVGYVYVVLGLPILLISFLISLLGSYLLVFLTMLPFSAIMQSIGIFDTSDLGTIINFSIGLVIYYFIIVYIQTTVFHNTWNAINNAFIVYISGSQERTVQALTGVQGDDRNLAQTLRPKGRV